MISGVTTAPALLAMFMAPMAMERSLGLKKTATVLIAVGVPKASVAPRARRTRVNWPRVRAAACAIAARLQAPTASGLARRHPKLSTSHPAPR
jgi:hypothetical protein